VRSSDGVNVINLSGTLSGRPACAKYDYWFIKDENSTAGKKQLALLMMAQAAGHVVTIEGSGACTRWGDGEDILGVSTTSQ
jgi:hypothetical protein